jgi:hypothetical protein
MSKIGKMFKSRRSLLIVGAISLVVIGVVLYIKLKPGKAPPQCPNGKAETCDGKYVCIKKCDTGKERCGDPCNNLCYDPLTDVCLDGKICSKSNACNHNGIPSICCNTGDTCSDTPQGSTCVNCPKGSTFCNGGCCSSDQTCCGGKNCCKNCLKNASNISACCDGITNPQVDSNGTCCNKSTIIDGLCCSGSVCVSLDSTGNIISKTCCASPEECHNTSVCMSTLPNISKSSPLQGKCISSPTSTGTYKSVCVSSKNFSDSTFGTCSTDANCGNGETCTKVYYNSIPGSSSMCSNDSQCSGMGSQGSIMKCYNQDSTGKLTPCDCSDKECLLKQGECSSACKDSKIPIWCPSSDACVSWSESGNSGGYCKSNNICSFGSTVNNPSLEIIDNNNTRTVCKQRYELPSSGVCLDKSTPSSDQTGKKWCNFNSGDTTTTPNSSWFNPIVGTSTSFPYLAAGTYSGPGTNFAGLPTSKQVNVFSGCPTQSDCITPFPAGIAGTGLQSWSEVSVPIADSNSCSAALCYNKLSQKGLASVSYDTSKPASDICSGVFECTSGANGVLMDKTTKCPADRVGRCCSSSDGTWSGMMCPSGYYCSPNKMYECTGTNCPAPPITSDLFLCQLE